MSSRATRNSCQYPSLRDSTAIIVQLGEASSFSTMDKFVDAVLALNLVYDQGERHLTFTTLSGDTIQTWGQSTKPTLINGVNLNPQCRESCIET